MLHPSHLIARAMEITELCGGVPDRVSLANPTPAVEVAWAAYGVAWNLMFARKHMGFLKGRGLMGMDRFAWSWIGCPLDRRKARLFIRLAGDALAKAERGFAALKETTG